MYTVLFCIKRNPVTLRVFLNSNICITCVDVTGCKLTQWTPAVMVIQFQVLSTHQEMIPATNAIEAHAQDSVVNNEMLLPILKAFSLHIRSMHATLRA
jgi:disulfide oxidoreductase YuzD